MFAFKYLKEMTAKGKMLKNKESQLELWELEC
jgi:hypothetical protein